jgi:hypothetical protein
MLRSAWPSAEWRGRGRKVKASETAMSRKVVFPDGKILQRGTRVRVYATAERLLFVESEWRDGQWLPLGRYIMPDEVEKAP